MTFLWSYINEEILVLRCTKHYKFAWRVVKKHTYNVTRRMKYEINVKKGSDIPNNFFIPQVSQYISCAIMRQAEWDVNLILVLNCWNEKLGKAAALQAPKMIS